MSVSTEALAGYDAVLVDDTESTKVLKPVARVVVRCERKMVEGLEPAVVCVPTCESRKRQPATSLVLPEPTTSLTLAGRFLVVRRHGRSLIRERC